MTNQIGNRERCKIPCGCCPVIDTNHDTCTGSGQIGHDGDWGLIGFSPCGEYVAHESNKPCDISGVLVEVLPEANCTCRTGYCPCGKFLSHKISEPCTAR
jgi:hypothetical protein